jgi:hypothetical protein
MQLLGKHLDEGKKEKPTESSGREARRLCSTTYRRTLRERWMDGWMDGLWTRNTFLKIIHQLLLE